MHPFLLAYSQSLVSSTACVSTAGAAAGLRNKQLMQRKLLYEPVLHVSGEQAVFVISASLGRRTVCVHVCTWRGDGCLCVGCWHGFHPKNRLACVYVFLLGANKHTHFHFPISIIRSD